MNILQRPVTVRCHETHKVPRHGLTERASARWLRASALQVWQQIAERYGSKAGIPGWALRTYEKTSQPEAAQIRDRLFNELAPDGLRQLTEDDATGPPTVGVLVNTERRLVTNAGLKMNDIIVGLRGYRVTNFEGNKLIREIEPNLDGIIKVWRNGKYLDLPPVPPGYRFGINLPDYRR